MTIKYFLTCIFLCVTCLTNSQSLLQVARSKAAENKLTEASVLYERILFEEQNQEQIDTAIFEKSELLKNNKLFSEADVFFEQHINSIKDSGILCQAHTNWLLILYLKNNLDRASSLATEINAYYPNSKYKKWIHFLQILIANENMQWIHAKNLWTQFINTYEIKDTTLVCNFYNAAPKLLNESKAMWLSTLLPGGGLFYVGKPFEGLTSVALQTLGVLYGISSYNEGYYFSSWLVGFGLFGSFKFGSTRRTETLVKQINKTKISSYNLSLRNELIKCYANSKQ